MDPRLQDLLRSSGAAYSVIPHPPTYTAMDAAAVTHTAGKELAKTVVVRVDGVLTLVVVPATHFADLDALQAITGAEMVQLSDEPEFAGRFPGCELGAIPPFGDLYGMPTYVSRSLADDTDIAFDGGTHTELVRMRYADYVRVARPVVESVSVPRAASHA